MVRKAGRMGLPTCPLKVRPSLSSFCRSPSSLCPTASWKSTPAASGASSAGPVYGSGTGVEGVLRLRHHLDLRLLAREAGRPVRVVGAVDLLALLLEIGRERLLVEIVGEQPQRVAQRGLVVVERRLATRAVARILAVE